MTDRFRPVATAARLAALASALVLLAAPARASVLLTVEPVNQAVVRGGTGALDVYLENTGAPLTGVNGLAGFNVTLSVLAGSGITFTGGTSTGVANFIFASGDVGLTFSNPGGVLTVGDIIDFPLTATVDVDTQKYGLGRLFFAVDPNAPVGPVAVTIDGATSFTNGNFGPLGGGYTGTGATLSVVPEPAGLTTGALVAAIGGAVAWRRRRSRRRTAVPA